MIVFMDKRLELNPMKDAWSSFMKKGISIQGLVRPEILNSWQRSREKHGLDPFERVIPQLSSDVLIARKNEYAELLSIAWPIMLELCATVNNSLICLADKEGCVLNVIGNNEFLPVGTCCQEENIGTNCIGTVLLDRKPLQINGYEHYLNCCHYLNSIGVPIKSGAEIIGVLCFISPLHELPDGMLQIVNIAAKGIGMELSEKQTLYSLIDCVHYGLFIVDGKGKIICINTKSQELLGLKDRKEIINQPLGKFVSNEKLLLKTLMKPQSGKCHFEIKTNVIVIQCSLRIKKTLRFSSNPDQTVILFTFSIELREREKDTGKLSSHDDLFSFEELVGRSEAWIKIKKLGVKAAQVNSNVLIEGESGTGKDMLAHAIHCASNRSGPFIPINCGAIPKELLQSELFGYEEGSFSGAKRGGAPGKFELADGGTIFLDEIGEMPVEMQVSLLRFLQDKTVVRVGGAEYKKVDVRVIAATNRNLEDAIRTKSFREDLFYRLNVINIKLPPLRQRKEDIPSLVDNMVEELSRELSQDVPVISDETFDILFQYDWPGNIRELHNVFEHAMVFAEGRPINPDCLPKRILQMKILEESEDLRIRELNLINKTLTEHNGNISQTARALGITRSTLYKKIQEIKHYHS
jgi:transcriptional regulator with PAS, ATPase and Fis domain